MAEAVPYVLWGSAGHAKVLADIIALRGGIVVACFDNNPDATPCLPGVPLYHGKDGFVQWRSWQQDARTIQAAIAIGGAKGADRRTLMAFLAAAGLTFPTLVHPSATVSPSAQLGAGCQVLAHCVVAADVRLGSACIINHSATVDHECKLGSGVHIAPGAVLCGCIAVGDNAMIGAGAVVLPRVRIGTGAVIGAGAVVTRDVPDSAVVVGNPARILRSKQ